MNAGIQPPAPQEQRAAQASTERPRREGGGSKLWRRPLSEQAKDTAGGFRAGGVRKVLRPAGYRS